MTQEQLDTIIEALAEAMREDLEGVNRRVDSLTTRLDSMVTIHEQTKEDLRNSVSTLEDTVRSIAQKINELQPALTTDEVYDVIGANVLKSVNSSLEASVIDLEGRQKMLISDHITRGINTAVKAAVDAIEIPAGRDGKDGIDGKDGADGADGKDGINGVDGSNGRDGIDGKDGINGIDGLNGVNGADGADGINGADGKDGVNGVDGMNGEPGVGVADFVDDGHSIIFTLSDGSAFIVKHGENGKDGADGRDGKDGLNGADGKDGADGRDGIDGANGVDGLNGADGKDGLDGKDGADGKDGRDGIDGLKGLDGIHGKDGADGVSLADATIDREGALILINSKGVQKNLGLVVGHDAIGRDGADGKDGKDGLDGMGFDDIQAEFDGERTVAIKFVKGESVKSFEFKMPTLIYRGFYKKDAAYETGDTVTYGGSTWHAKRDTLEAPSEASDDWTLAVRRGLTGASVKGERGEKGIDGKNGKDMTQIGPNGEKW